MSREHRRLLSMRGLLPGRGRSDAVRVWLVLWSHAKRKAKHGEVWPSNKRIGALAGLDLRRTVRAISLLTASGLVSVRWGRPFGARKPRRIITLQPGMTRTSNPRVSVPTSSAMPAILRMLGKVRDRPGTCVGLLLAINVCAGMNGGDESFVTLATLRDMTDSTAGRSFYDRLAALEQAGMIGRVGDSWSDGIRVADLDDAQAIEMRRAIGDLPRMAAVKKMATEPEARSPMFEQVVEPFDPCVWEPVSDDWPHAAFG